jgi:hypothetical protein
MRSSLTLPARLLLLLPFWFALLLSARSLADEAARAKLLQAIRAEDAAEQVTAVRELISTDDALVLQALAAWRLGNLFLWEPPDGGTGEPFLVDGATDAEGRSNGLRVRDGKPLIDATGAPVRQLGIVRRTTPSMRDLRHLMSPVAASKHMKAPLVVWRYSCLVSAS